MFSKLQIKQKLQLRAIPMIKRELTSSTIVHLHFVMSLFYLVAVAVAGGVVERGLVSSK